MRKVICLSALGLFVFGIVGYSSAMDACDSKECSTQGQTTGNPAETKKAVDAGNTICPMTGEKINDKTKGTYEYEGKIYNFCCPMCIGDFKKDPEKYIKKIEGEKAK